MLSSFLFLERLWTNLSRVFQLSTTLSFFIAEFKRLSIAILKKYKLKKEVQVKKK